MSDQVSNEAEEVVPVPPKGSGSGKKVLLVILGVLVACMLLFGIVLTAGVLYVKNRGANIVKDIAKTQGVDVKNYDAKNGTAEYSIKTEDGEITSKVSKELPDDYPTNELPVYDGVITSTNRMNLSGNVSWMVSMESQDSADAVGDAVKKELKDHGWEIIMEQDNDGRSLKTAKKGDYTAMVSYESDTNDAEQKITRITYNVSQKGKDQQ